MLATKHWGRSCRDFSPLSQPIYPTEPVENHPSHTEVISPTDCKPNWSQRSFKGLQLGKFAGFSILLIPVVGEKPCMPWHYEVTNLLLMGTVLVGLWWSPIGPNLLPTTNEVNTSVVESDFDPLVTFHLCRWVLIPALPVWSTTESPSIAWRELPGRLLNSTSPDWWWRAFPNDKKSLLLFLEARVTAAQYMDILEIHICHSQGNPSFKLVGRLCGFGPNSPSTTPHLWGEGSCARVWNKCAHCTSCKQSAWLVGIWTSTTRWNWSLGFAINLNFLWFYFKNHTECKFIGNNDHQTLHSVKRASDNLSHWYSTHYVQTIGNIWGVTTFFPRLFLTQILLKFVPKELIDNK